MYIQKRSHVKNISSKAANQGTKYGVLYVMISILVYNLFYSQESLGQAEGFFTMLFVITAFAGASLFSGSLLMWKLKQEEYSHNDLGYALIVGMCLLFFSSVVLLKLDKLGMSFAHVLIVSVGTVWIYYTTRYISSIDLTSTIKSIVVTVRGYEVVTAKQAAQHYGVTRTTIYNWIKQGKLDAQKKNKHWRIKIYD